MKKIILILILCITCHFYASSQDAYIGEIRLFAGDFAPRGWAFCNGQILPISQNTALFSLLGTTYGGDGRSTFALPNLKSRVPLQQGTGPGLSTYELGETGGQETVTLLASDLPPHTHTVTVTQPKMENKGTSDDPTGRQTAMSVVTPYSPQTDGTTMAAPNVSIAPTGGNQAMNNMQPYLVLNYIICLQGVFPQRN